MLKTFLDWHPTVWHDLHESVTLLYVSTGTGPYNTVVDPIQVNEWWLLAQNEIMEMTKRGVPGVWTYNYYDGWVPNYMFWIGVTHNSIGRFYETQSFGGAATVRCRVQQSREWYRPNPTPPRHAVGPAQQREHAAERAPDRDELRSRRTRRRSSRTTTSRTSTRWSAAGRRRPTRTSIPAKQRRMVEAAELMNLIRREGAEVHTASAAFTIGNIAGRARRLHRPHGSAVQRDRRDAARRAVLRAGEPAPVRRHRLGDPAGAQREGDARRRQVDPRQADDAGDRRLQDCRARSPAPAAS